MYLVATRSGARARGGRRAPSPPGPPCGARRASRPAPPPRRRRGRSRAGDEAHALVGVLHHLADQVLAGDAEMGGAAFQELRDLARRDEIDLDVRQPVDLALVAARRARSHDHEAGLGERGVALLHQAALGGQRQRSLPLPLPPRSWRRSLQHGEQALGVDPSADGGHAARAHRHRRAGRRSGRRRRWGFWGRARVRSPRTRSRCNIRGCGRTRRRTRRRQIDAGLGDEIEAAPERVEAGGDIDVAGAHDAGDAGRRPRAPAPSWPHSSRSARRSRAAAASRACRRPRPAAARRSRRPCACRSARCRPAPGTPAPALRRPPHRRGRACRSARAAGPAPGRRRPMSAG